MRAPSDIDTIIVHCLAVAPDWMKGRPLAEKLAEVTRWHTAPKPKGRGWKAVAYARIIDRDGSWINGRDLDGDGDPFDEIGAHASGHNAKSVGVALVGGLGSNEKDDFFDHFTPEQDAALVAVIREIEAYAGKKLKVIGHNQIAAKACPGFQVPEWLPQAMARHPAKPARKAGRLPPLAPPVDYVVEPAKTSLWARLADLIAAILRGGRK
jgi:hypothetical protein